MFNVNIYIYIYIYIYIKNKTFITQGVIFRFLLITKHNQNAQNDGNRAQPLNSF